MPVLILHPGDLSLWQLVGILVVLAALTIVPLAIIGLIIYKVTRSHSSDSDTGTTTLGLNKK